MTIQATKKSGQWEAQLYKEFGFMNIDLVSTSTPEQVKEFLLTSTSNKNKIKFI